MSLPESRSLRCVVRMDEPVQRQIAIATMRLSERGGSRDERGDSGLRPDRADRAPIDVVAQGADRSSVLAAAECSLGERSGIGDWISWSNFSRLISAACEQTKV